jgi:hypothetical protein
MIPRSLNAVPARRGRRSPGARLAATFPRAPHCVNYAVKGQAGEVWLLRPAAETPVVPPCQPVTGLPARASIYVTQ